MPFESPPTNDRKRKPTEAPEPVAVSSSSSTAVDESRRWDTRPRRVSTEAPSNVVPSTYASSMDTGTPERNHATMPIGSSSVESVGKLIQDLSSPDEAVVKASTYKLGRSVCDSYRGSQILQEIVGVGGCFALVQLAKTSLEKARMEIPNCDQVTELNGGATEILRNLFFTMACLTYKHPVSKDIISSIGGVKLVVKVLKTFPKCEDLQSAACNVLCNLTTTFVGVQKASEVDATKVLLTTVKSYPANMVIFCIGCHALTNICESNFEQTKLLIDLGSITTWPDDPGSRAAAKTLLQVMANGIHYLIHMY